MEELGETIRGLAPFADHSPESKAPPPFTFPDYLELEDWSGRAIAQGKRGTIPEKLSPILQRLGIQPAGCVKYIRKQENGFHHVIGTIESLKALASRFGQKFFKG